jgi:hypothetical protein
MIHTCMPMAQRNRSCQDDVDLICFGWSRPPGPTMSLLHPFLFFFWLTRYIQSRCRYEFIENIRIFSFRLSLGHDLNKKIGVSDPRVQL